MNYYPENNYRRRYRKMFWLWLFWQCEEEQKQYIKAVSYLYDIDLSSIYE